MVTSELKQEYKAQYDSELARREELNKAVDRPIGLIGVFVALVYFALLELTAPATAPSVVQALIAIVLIALLAMAAHGIVSSYYGHTYKFVPTPVELEKYRSELEEYHARYSARPPEEISRKVLEYLFEAYIVGADWNATINDQRNSYLHRAKTMLVLAVPVIVLLVVLRIASTPAFSSWVRSLPSLLT